MLRHLTTMLMVLPAVLGSMPALAQTPSEGPYYWHHGWDMGWGHMIFGSLMMVLLLGGIIVAIVVAVRWLGGGSSHGTMSTSSRNKSLEILQERFARGEIDKDEFEERKRLLSS